MPEGKPDALMIRMGWEPPTNVQEGDREYRVHLYANKVLDTTAHMCDTVFDNVWKFWAPGPTREHTVNYPKAHPKAGEPRYDWVDQANGCKFGYLKPDDSGYKGPPLTAEHISEARAEALRRVEAALVRLTELEGMDADALTDDEKAEMDQLAQLKAVVSGG